MKEPDANTGPVFIGGLSYSGKTPLRLMLSSHSSFALSRRTYMWQRFYGRYGDLGQRENFERCLAAMLANRTVAALSPDPERLRREYWQGRPGYGPLFALIHEHFAQSCGRRRWGAQIGLIEAYADVIFADFPTATMIHMIRDPRSRQGSASAGSRQRAGKTGWETARWLYSARLAQRNESRYAGRYLVIGYETLAAEPERVMRGLCRVLGETFEPAMLTMEPAVRFGEPPSEVAREPQAETIPGRELAFTQAYAGRHITDFGYKLRPVELTFKERLLFNIFDRPANLASMVAWRTLQTIRT